MSHAAPQPQNLLVKIEPGRERRFVLEDLRTGRRCEFDSATPLLDRLSELLQPDSPKTRSEPCS